MIFCRREDSLDVEVAVSGFTKEMEQDLDAEIHGELSDEEEEGDESVEDNEDAKSNPENSEEESKENEDHFISEDVSDLQQDFSKALQELQLDSVPSNQQNQEDEENDDKESESRFSCMSRFSHSTAATIPPEVIKDRIKKSFSKSDKMAVKKRIRAKGEASATTRSRRENRETIKTSQGLWG